MKRTVLDDLRRARREKRAVALVTYLNSNIQKILYLSDLKNKNDEISIAVRRAFRTDRSGVATTDEDPVFIQVANPPLRLIIVGAVHIAQALAPMAALAGYDVTVVDPRRSFATDSRFPDVAIRTDWPDTALSDMGLDSRSAVVTLTHDPKLDDPALNVALRSACFYIGSLGSKKTHGARLQRLREAGFDEAALSRIHGPVGLDIGARSQGEIAVSILAQITEALRHGGES